VDQLDQSKIILNQFHCNRLFSIATKTRPNEACGILAGIGHICEQVYQITNVLNSPVEFLMAPEEMVKVFWEIEQSNLEAIAFFHSHPTSKPIPSQTDLERNYYPDTPQLIIGMDNGGWTMRCYLLSPTSFQEIPIKIIK